MPIVDVELVGPAGVPPGLAERIADSVGRALAAAERTTWVRVRELPRSRHGESGGGPPADVNPVFVTILERHRPTGHDLADAVTAVTDAVSAMTGRARGDVHVLFAEDGAGRLGFGGEVVD